MNTESAGADEEGLRVNKELPRANTESVEGTAKEEAAMEKEAAPNKDKEAKKEAALKKEAVLKEEAAPNKEVAAKKEAATKKEAAPDKEAAAKEEAASDKEAGAKKEAAAKRASKGGGGSKKALIIEGLQPSAWFAGKLKNWHSLRDTMRKKQKEYIGRKVQAAKKGEAFDDDALDRVDIAGVTDIHNADGKASALYAHFVYEDWVIVRLGVELHLLLVAFLRDVKDANLTGILEGHVGHYYELYYKQKLNLGMTGEDTLEEVLEIIQDQPMDLFDFDGVLRPMLPAEAPLEDIVKLAEYYRRERVRRVKAGNVSELFTFPRPAELGKAPAASLVKEAKEAATGEQVTARAGCSNGVENGAKREAAPKMQASSKASSKMEAASWADLSSDVVEEAAMARLRVSGCVSSARNNSSAN